MNRDTMLEAGFPTHMAGYPAAYAGAARAAGMAEGWYMTSRGERTGGPAPEACYADTLALLDLAARQGLPAPLVAPRPHSSRGVDLVFEDQEAAVCALEWVRAGRWLVWTDYMQDVPLRGPHVALACIRGQLERIGR